MLGHDNPHDNLQYTYYTLSELIKKSEKRELFHNWFVGVTASDLHRTPRAKKSPIKRHKISHALGRRP
jgi:hypothetical protein